MVSRASVCILLYFAALMWLAAFGAFYFVCDIAGYGYPSWRPYETAISGLLISSATAHLVYLWATSKPFRIEIAEPEPIEGDPLIVDGVLLIGSAPVFLGGYIEIEVPPGQYDMTLTTSNRVRDDGAVVRKSPTLVTLVRGGPRIRQYQSRDVVWYEMCEYSLVVANCTTQKLLANKDAFGVAEEAAQQSICNALEPAGRLQAAGIGIDGIVVSVGGPFIKISQTLADDKFVIQIELSESAPE